MKRRWKQTAGFTLVELIVVIAILGILAGVGVPTYSGYVKKANMAADQTLLDSVNTAFAAACIENGENINEVQNATLAIDDDTRTVDVENSMLVNPDVRTDFGTYFGADSSTQFKVLKNGDVGFDKDNHIFKIVTDIDLGVYANLTFAPELISRVKDSMFMKAPGLGVYNLLDKVNSIGYEAAKYAGTPGSGAALMLEDYTDDLLADLGFTKPLDQMTGDELLAMNAAIEKMNLEKQAILAAQIDGFAELDPEVRKTLAGNAILSGYAVLDAAQGMNGKSVETVLTEIKAETNFKTLITNSDSETAVATASAAYGLYTAYAYALPEGEARTEAIKKTQNPSALLETMMSDTGFTAYLAGEQAKVDLDGYLAAMQMIDSSATDKDAVQSLVVNGFTDPALVAAIQQQMK